MPKGATPLKARERYRRPAAARPGGGRGVPRGALGAFRGGAVRARQPRRRPARVAARARGGAGGGAFRSGELRGAAAGRRGRARGRASRRSSTMPERRASAAVRRRPRSGARSHALPYGALDVRRKGGPRCPCELPAFRSSACSSSPPAARPASQRVITGAAGGAVAGEVLADEPLVGAGDRRRPPARSADRRPMAAHPPPIAGWPRPGHGRGRSHFKQEGRA